MPKIPCRAGADGTVWLLAMCLRWGFSGSGMIRWEACASARGCGRVRCRSRYAELAPLVASGGVPRRRPRAALWPGGRSRRRCRVGHRRTHAAPYQANAPTTGTPPPHYRPPVPTTRLPLTEATKRTLRSPVMATLPDLLLVLTPLMMLALVAGGVQAATNRQWRYAGSPASMAVVGISFMLSAGIVSVAELPDSEILPPAGALRLRDDLRAWPEAVDG